MRRLLTYVLSLIAAMSLVVGVTTTGYAQGVTSAHPPGAPSNWTPRSADNGKGVVYQEPGSSGNANMVRVMEPTPLYPHGYVRFYNEYGQPIGLDGKPGPDLDTHIPINADGSYPIPQGWPATDFPVNADEPPPTDTGELPLAEV